MLGVESQVTHRGRACRSRAEAESLDVVEAIKVHIQMIHRRWLAQSGPGSPLAGMGITLTGALTVGFNAFVAHVGDSRAYLFRNQALQRLTCDHTLAEDLVSAGIARSTDDAAVAGFRHTLVNCLGGGVEDVDVDTCHVPLQDGDQLLLCTDGLTDMVPEAGIAQLLAEPHAAQQVCEKLIDAALVHGGSDNVTAVLARYAAVS